MPVKLDVDSLRALKSVADHGGVTKAAQYLSLSQSAVSHKIKRLEENIDCALLARQVGAPLLTEAGERLLGYAHRILSLHDEAVVSLSKRTLVGNIRVGMTEDMSSSGLARILARYARIFRDVSVRTHVAQSMVLQKELNEGAIDLGVMQIFTHDLQQDDIELFRCRLQWAKAQDFQMPAEGVVPFLAYNDQCFYKNWVLEHTCFMRWQLNTVLECATNVGIISAIEAGLGISIINEHHITHTMEVMEEGFQAPPCISYVIRVASKAKPNVVKSLVDEISREYANTPQLHVV